MDSLSVTASSNQTFTVGNTFQILFPNTILSSSNYDTSTSIYTVPSNGNYLINICVGIDYIMNDDLAQSSLSLNLMQNSTILQTSTITIIGNDVYGTLLQHVELLLCYYGPLTASSQISLNFTSAALLLTSGTYNQLNSNSSDTLMSIIQIS